MKKKKDNYILLIIICLILISIVVLLFIDQDDDNAVVLEPKYQLLEDYSRFFTVNSCAYKYINYITSNKVSDLLNVLDESFIENNNINENNVFNYIDKLSGNYSFKSKKIYYQQINDNYINYYVYGYLIEDTIDGNGVKNDYYLKINLDLKNQLFSVAPYDGTIFKEEK